MTNKMTKKDSFSAIIAILADMDNTSELIAFCEHEIELLTKKYNGEKKPTKTQIENETYKADILAFLANADQPVTIQDIQKGVESVSEFSTSKMSALLTQLISTGKVVKEYDKKKAHYSLA